MASKKQFEDLTVADYKRALLDAEEQIADVHRKMLAVHYRAEGRTITTSAMAEAMGWRGKAANLKYGQLGSILCDHYGIHPAQTVFALATFTRPHVAENDEWLWTMRDQVATALEEFGWVGTQVSPTYLSLGILEIITGLILRKNALRSRSVASDEETGAAAAVNRFHQESGFSF